jgi:(4S)-4-hydroxy-5-phosphonooxypentane-2,3-dione isomerase
MNPEPIYVFAKWQVQTGRLDEVLPLLREVAAQSTREPGNLFYQVHQSTADNNTLLLYEAYRDESALAAHRDTDHFKNLVLGKIIPLLAHREVVLTRSLS